MMKNRVAFTLPQLLVTVAVASLLAFALLPSLQSDHATLQRALCVNNLREIGQAITLYAADSNDCFPPGYVSGVTDWHLIIGPYVAMTHITYSSGPARSPVFICPAAVQAPPPGTTTTLTYTAHRAMFWCNPPCTFPSGTIVQYKLSQCTRPGEVAMVFDGCLSQTSGNTFDAQACSDQLTDTTIAYPGTNPNQAEPVGANVDGPAGVGLIRWRHSNSNTNGANFLMVDGHVQSLLVGQLLRRNLRYDK